MRRVLLLIIALLALSHAATATAHTRSESHSSWLVDGTAVHLTFSVSDVEASRIAKGRPPDDRALIAYLNAREGVTANGAPCPRAVPPHAIAAAPGYRRIEFLYECPTTKKMVLHNAAFFDLVPSHFNLAQIQTAKGDYVQDVLTGGDHDVDMSAASGGELAQAGFLTFMRMGVMHIFTGVDHMSFLLGLVLISRRFRDLTFVITGFTLGHSLTLALAFTGVIRPHAEFIDALVALTIALIGIENISVATHRPGLLALWTAGALFLMTAMRLMGVGLLPPLLLFGAGLFASNYLMVSGHIRDAARLRLVVTLVFGLIHGFGFAADLLSEPLPANRLAELLVGFNLGVEVGQLTIVVLLTASVFLLSKLKLTLPRPIVVDVTAASLVGIGVYWFVGRSFA